MTKLPVLTAVQVIRGLKKAGFVFDRQAKSSHEVWYRSGIILLPREERRFQIIQGQIFRKEL